MEIHIVMLLIFMLFMLKKVGITDWDFRLQ